MLVYSRWWKETETMLFIFIFITLAHLRCVHSADDVLRGNDPSKTPQSGQYTLAEITVISKISKNKDRIQGKFGLNSVTKTVKGIVVYAESKTKKEKKINHWGCTNYTNDIPVEKWIALVERGKCEFSQKVQMATTIYKASAVVVYDGDGSNANSEFIMNQGEKNSVSVFISNRDGKKLVSLMSKGPVTMKIVPGEEVPFDHSAENNISKTSVLFVSISFIVLMIISLAWLVFYYIQRFRYSHAKERLARRLACAAKKAIAKIPQSTVRSGDKVLEGDHDQCAVCIEQYKQHDVIRILPCSHIFHKSCVDPWLQENRSCPMCKMDILAAYGMQIGTSQESVHHNADPGPATQLVIEEEPEVSSSLEDAAPPTEVVLPFICLHKNREEDNEAEQPNTLLLGAGLSSENIRLSSTSLSSNKSTDSGKGSSSLLSRIEKRDKEESNNIEMKALIEKESYDDEDEYNDDNGIISNDSSCGDRQSKTKIDCIAVDKSAEESGSPSSSSLELKNSDKRNNSNTSVSADRRSNKDTVSIIVLDTGGGGDSVGAVEFHQEQDLSPTNSFSHA